MKIGQVIDNVYQNKELEYESEKLYIGFNKTLREVIIKPKNSSYNTVVLLGCYDKERFELVQKPVTFMEAVESGKLIKVEHGSISKDYMSGYYYLTDFLERLTTGFGGAVIRAILTEGKFYIKGDN